MTIKEFFSKYFLILAISLLAPGIALANTQNAWELYVFGNGEYIKDILIGIKLLIGGDGVTSNTGFRSLLVTIGISALLFSVLQAFSNPQQGFVKVFLLIIGYMFISVSTFNTRMNVAVLDTVSPSNITVVDNVPASVAFVPVLVSRMGVFMTQSIETYFQVPGVNNNAFSLVNGQQRGFFNLFGKFVTDLDKVQIGDLDFKRSLQAYMSDCVVNSMALGSLTANELISSNKLIGLPSATPGTPEAGTLSKAASVSLLTVSFPINIPASGATAGSVQICSEQYAPDGTATGNVAFTNAPPPTLGGFTNSNLGNVMSCRAAYNCLVKAGESYGEGLFNLKAADLSNSGVLTPLETITDASLAMLGSTNVGGTGQPRAQSLILQKAILNSSSDAFKAAAVQSGNNELLQSVTLSQVEQATKTSWITASSAFANMAGYVYIVFQCFIFMLTPLLLVAAMVPGLGKALLKSYLQIMVWMALWLPGLAIVNYLVTLFGKGDLFNVWNSTNGLSMSNHLLISERANNLSAIAQFLGASVPLFMWGFVKGTMSLAEFLGGAVGTNIASGAASGLARGAMDPMGTIVMNNASANQSSFAASSAMGDRGSLFSNMAGVQSQSTSKGGTNLDNNSPKGSINTTADMNAGTGVAAVDSASRNASYETNANASTSGGTGSTSSRGLSSETGGSLDRNFSDSNNSSRTIQSGDNASNSQSVDRSRDLANAAVAEGGGGIGGNVASSGGPSSGKGAGNNPAAAAAGAAGGSPVLGAVNAKAGYTERGALSDSAGTSVGSNVGNSFSDTNAAGNSKNVGTSGSISQREASNSSVSSGTNFSNNGSMGASASNSVSAGSSVTSTEQTTSGVGFKVDVSGVAGEFRGSNYSGFSNPEDNRLAMSKSLINDASSVLGSGPLFNEFNKAMGPLLSEDVREFYSTTAKKAATFANDASSDIAAGSSSVVTSAAQAIEQGQTSLYQGNGALGKASEMYSLLSGKVSSDFNFTNKEVNDGFGYNAGVINGITGALGGANAFQNVTMDDLNNPLSGLNEKGGFGVNGSLAGAMAAGGAGAILGTATSIAGDVAATRAAKSAMGGGTGLSTVATKAGGTAATAGGIMARGAGFGLVGAAVAGVAAGGYLAYENDFLGFKGFVDDNILSKFNQGISSSTEGSTLTPDYSAYNTASVKK